MEDGDVSLDSPDIPAKVRVTTITRLAPPSTPDAQVIFNEIEGMGNGLGHRPQQFRVAAAPQTHDTRAEVPMNKSTDQVSSYCH